MSDFKPLRRKIGVVTLVLACVFTAAWVTSYSQMEEAYFSCVRNKRLVRSFEGEIIYMEEPPWELIYNDGSGLRRDHFVSILKSEARRMVINDDTIIRIPYWSIAAPLILLSAWLLLSKPRAYKIISPTSLPNDSSAAKIEGLD